MILWACLLPFEKFHPFWSILFYVRGQLVSICLYLGAIWGGQLPNNIFYIITFQTMSATFWKIIPFLIHIVLCPGPTCVNLSIFGSNMRWPAAAANNFSQYLIWSQNVARVHQYWYLSNILEYFLQFLNDNLVTQLFWHIFFYADWNQIFVSFFMNNDCSSHKM